MPISYAFKKQHLFFKVGAGLTVDQTNFNESGWFDYNASEVSFDQDNEAKIKSLIVRLDAEMGDDDRAFIRIGATINPSSSLTFTQSSHFSNLMTNRSDSNLNHQSDTTLDLSYKLTGECRYRLSEGLVLFANARYSFTPYSYSLKTPDVDGQGSVIPVVTTFAPMRASLM